MKEPIDKTIEFEDLPFNLMGEAVDEKTFHFSLDRENERQEAIAREKKRQGDFYATDKRD